MKVWDRTKTGKEGEGTHDIINPHLNCRRAFPGQILKTVEMSGESTINTGDFDGLSF